MLGRNCYGGTSGAHKIARDDFVDMQRRETLGDALCLS